MPFGFWIKAGPTYSAQCPACEDPKKVKLIEVQFGGIEHYKCHGCGCTWLYKRVESEGQYADAMNDGLIVNVLRRV